MAVDLSCRVFNPVVIRRKLEPDNAEQERVDWLATDQSDPQGAYLLPRQ